MKILLCTPQPLYYRWPTTPDTTRMITNAAPVTLAQLAGALQGHDVRILDGNVYTVSLKRYADLIRWADVIGINVMSSYAALNTELNVRFIRCVNPSAIVVMGGHHATFLDREWIARGADIVVRREGEETFPRLVEALAETRDLGTIEGITWRRDEEIVRNRDRKFIECLDTIPFPRWDLVDFSGYYLFARGKGKAACLETGRGCEQHCSFCQVGAMWKHKHRFKSVERVVEEMRLLKRLGVTQLYIVDDNYGSTLDIERQYRLYEEMLSQDLRFDWGGFFRVDYLASDPHLVRLAVRAGLKFVTVGFESVSSEDISRFRKGEAQYYQPATYEEIYRFLKSLGVVVFGFIVIGYPGQSMEAALRTLECSSRFCDYPVVTLYKPLPGTPGYKTTVNEGLLAKEMFYHDSYIVAVKGTRPLLNAYNRFFLGYLTNPVRVFSHLRDRNLRAVEKAICRWFAGGLLRANRRNVADFLWLVTKGRNLDEEEIMQTLVKRNLSEENLARLLREAGVSGQDVVEPRGLTNQRCGRIETGEQPSGLNHAFLPSVAENGNCFRGLR